MKKHFVVVLTLVLIMELICGCQNQAQRRPIAGDTPPQKSDNGLNASERRIMAGRISNIAESVEGVERAAAIVPPIETSRINSTVIVGLTVDSDIISDEEKRKAITKIVMDKIAKQEKDVSKALVTTEPKLVSRISTIAIAIVEGVAINKYQKEINELMVLLGEPAQKTPRQAPRQPLL